MIKFPKHEAYPGGQLLVAGMSAPVRNLVQNRIAISKAEPRATAIQKIYLDEISQKTSEKLVPAYVPVGAKTACSATGGRVTSPRAL